MTGQPSRAELVAGLRARSESAWCEFVQTYGGLIHAVAARLDLSEADREDLIQETCLTALRAIHTLQSADRLASWVYTIAYRLGIDRLRRRPEESLEGLGTIADQQAAGAIDPDALVRLERLESIAHLHDALAQLDERCRQLLTALYLEDPQATYDTVARRQNLPIGSIGPTRARCLQKAYRLLKGLSDSPLHPSADRSRAAARGNPWAKEEQES
jgi:RNA polymerase sigma factor (sigma-70 family)